MPVFSPTSQADETALSLTPRTTDLSSEGLKRAWSEKIKDAALFSARTTKETYLKMIRKFLGAVASGATTPQVAETKLRQTLENLGYKPETGFPDNNGRVPPATPGSIQDLSSSRRIELILDTNVKQARSLGQIAASENPMNLFSVPAWRLTRTGARKKPRGDWKRRWEAAGNACGWEGAAKNVFVALKTSPIWKQIGKGAGGFTDTIGTEYPPFAFGSGMAWVGVSRREWMRICESENIPSGDEERMEAARQFRRLQETPQKPLVKPPQENPSIYTSLANKPRRTQEIKDLRKDMTLTVPVRLDEAVSEAKTKAKRGISEARNNVRDFISALSEKYIPITRTTLERIEKHGRERGISTGGERNIIMAALYRYQIALERLQGFDRQLAKMYLTVTSAQAPTGDFAQEGFETRMNRFLVASGRYENYAIEEFNGCKEANLKVKTAVDAFKVRTDAAQGVTP